MSNTLIKYKIQINVQYNGDEGSDIYIGISSHDDYLDRGFKKKSNIFYAFKSSRRKKSNCTIHANYGKEYGMYDVVTLLLNLKNGTIEFEVNEVSQGIAFDNIQKGDDIKYKFVVSLWNNKDSLTVIDGLFVGFIDGFIDGLFVGFFVGDIVGAVVGFVVGDIVGFFVGDIVGYFVIGFVLGFNDGDEVGDKLIGSCVGDGVGDGVGDE